MRHQSPNLFAVCCATAVLTSVAYSGQDAKSIFTKAQGAILTVQTGKALGTGFVVSDGTLVVTCYHVIKTDQGHIKVGSSTFQNAEVIQTSPEFDIAVLRVVNAYPTRLALNQKQTPPTGTKVFVIGSPLGLEKSMSEGILSGLRREGDLAYVQVTAPISHGSSGSPILDSTGQVLAMASMSLEKGQGLNFGISAFNLTKVLNQASAGLALDRLLHKVEAKPQTKKELPRQPVSKYEDPPGHLNYKRLMRDARSGGAKEQDEAFAEVFKFGPSCIPDILKYLDEDSPGFPKRDILASSPLKWFGSPGKPFLLTAIKKGTNLSKLVCIQQLGDLAYLQSHQESVDGDKYPGHGDDPWLYDNDVKETLLDSCDDQTPIIAVSAISTCGDLGFKAATRAAEKLLADKTQSEVLRGDALKALAKLEPTDSKNLLFLCEDLVGESMTMSSNLLWGLSNIKNDTAYYLLERITASHSYSRTKESSSLRAALISILSEYHKKETLEIARRMLTDPEKRVRSSAATAIGKAGGPDALSELYGLIKSDDRSIVGGAIIGIGASKNREAYKYLCDLATAKTGWEVDAILGLGELEDFKAIDFLTQFISDPDPNTKSRAKYVLENLVKLKSKQKKQESISI